MKKITPRILSLCLLCACLSSCSKKDHSTPQPTQPTGSLVLNLSYPDSSKSLGNFELIVNEPGGKILLDTEMAANTTLMRTLRTNDTIVDLTTITRLDSQYIVKCYKGVNPSRWASIAPPAFYNLEKPITFVPYSQANLVYNNPPAITGRLTDPSVLMMNNFSPTNAIVQTYLPGGISYQQGSPLKITYNNYGNNTVYLLFPQLGLYNFHPWHSGADTVDLTHMDTAISLTYAKPPSTTLIYTRLRGFLDATHPSNVVDLFITPYNITLADLEYPAKGVQQYELYTIASNPSKESYGFYFYGNSIPTGLPFPTAATYTIQTNQEDNFAVQFLAPRPSVYDMNWTVGPINLTVFASPDSTSLHPSTLLSSLHSKMLQGQSFTGLTPLYFEWQQLTGLDYGNALGYYFNPTSWTSVRLDGSMEVGRNF
jgi:hypothetical protein